MEVYSPIDICIHFLCKNTISEPSEKKKQDLVQQQKEKAMLVIFVRGLGKQSQNISSRISDRCKFWDDIGTILGKPEQNDMSYENYDKQC